MMDNINLDDYYVSIEYLDPDHDVDEWISTGNSEKILKKMNKLYKNGGSFTSNKYQVTSTDPVLLPFMYYNGTKYIIEYAETRLINFCPSISDLSNIINKMKSETVDLDISRQPEKKSKKRDFTEFNKDVKNESISQKSKKRRLDEKNNSDEIADVTTKKHKKKKKSIIEEKMSTPIKSEPAVKKATPESKICKVDENNNSYKIPSTNDINDFTTKKLKKKKKKKNTEENMSNEIPIKLEPTVKNKKKSINNEALDTSIVKTECSVQECEIPKNMEKDINSSTKKTKEKSKFKSHPPVAEVKTEPIEISYPIHKEVDEINTNIKCEPDEYYVSSKLYDANDKTVKDQKHKKKRSSETEMILDIKKEKVKKSKKHK